jgi:hypothetical protein
MAQCIYRHMPNSNQLVERLALSTLVPRLGRRPEEGLPQWNAAIQMLLDAATFSARDNRSIFGSASPIDSAHPGGDRAHTTIFINVRTASS